MKFLENAKGIINDFSTAPRCKDYIFLGFRDRPEFEERCKKGRFTTPYSIGCEYYKNIDEMIKKYNIDSDSDI